MCIMANNRRQFSLGWLTTGAAKTLSQHGLLETLRPRHAVNLIAENSASFPLKVSNEKPQA